MHGGRLAKKNIFRAERTANREREGGKSAIFSTVVTGDIYEISPFSSFASFRMRRLLGARCERSAESEQIKDERAEPNSFGVTVDDSRGRGGKAQFRGALFPQLWLPGRRKIKGKL